ncbi:MAG TPA: dodecin family protein [Pyrinomonadaceae bacterium]|nr:dodecin family protein [Pyrinomonadaceae bacterium]
MSVAKNIEISSTSTKSFDDAINQGIQRASQSLKNVRGAWIKEQKVNVKNGTITEYDVIMVVPFVLDEESQIGEETNISSKSSGKSSGRKK